VTDDAHQVDGAVQHDPPAVGGHVLGPELVAGREGDLRAQRDEVLELLVGDLLEEGEPAQLVGGRHVDAR
jgi:hypothetical protein